MTTASFPAFRATCVAAAIALSACSSAPATSTGDAGSDAAQPAQDPSTLGDTQTPATGDDATISAWLAKGEYKAWTCEPAVHDARSPSPHGKNRICSNTLSSKHAAGEFPVGAANVKEIYDEAGQKVVGFAIARKVAAGAGDAWYWYEKTGTSVVANGLGVEGAPMAVCVGCHKGAGSDAKHSGHDLVYTQVK